MSSNFRRTPEGHYIEGPKPKAWSLNPLDTRCTWDRWEFCLVDFEAGMTDGPELDLITRMKGDVEWNGIGPAAGNVYMSNPWAGHSWEQDMGAAGGFDAWWAQIMLRINEKLAPLCAQLNPAIPPCQMTLATSAPVSMASWNAAMAWLYANVKWGDAAAAPSVPGTVPSTPGGLPLYGPRAFFARFGFDCGVEADGVTPACMVNTPTGWKKFIYPG